MTLADYESIPGAAELPAQRVIEVTRKSNGTATISVGEATSLASLLDELPKREKRKKHHRDRGKR